MKKSSKIILIISAVLFVIGGIITGVAFGMGGEISTTEYTEKTYKIDQRFNDISVSAGMYDIELRLSETGKSYVDCLESDDVKISVEVENNTLKIYEKIIATLIKPVIFNTESPYAVIYLSEKEYKNLEIKTSSGDIECLENDLYFVNGELSASSGDIEFSANVSEELTAETFSGNIEFKDKKAAFGNASLSATSGNIQLLSAVKNNLLADTSSGDIEIDNSSPRTAEISATSGDIQLKNVIAESKLSAETSSGNITLKKCDSKEIELESTSGDIDGTLLSDKLFEADSSSGNIDCPPSIKDGDMCRITTTSGDISISIAQ